MMKSGTGIAIFFLIGAVLGASSRNGSVRHATQAEVRRVGYDPKTFGEVRDLIKRKHVNAKLTDADLHYGSLKGMVAATGDPYAHFLTPTEAALNDTAMTGTFTGIGAKLTVDNGKVKVLTPIDGSPADKAGVRPGDIIRSINGQATAGEKLDDVRLRIRGEKGSTVTLTVERGAAIVDIPIVRDEIVTDNVAWKIIPHAGKSYMFVDLKRFDQRADKLFSIAAVKAASELVSGIIVDLRGNRGGLMHVALSITCHWLLPGPVVTTETRTDSPDTDSCFRKGILIGMPTVVLIDGGSASASEIMAGALQDYGAARLIGEKTYGKGSAQTTVTFGDKSELKMTTALWKTPKGRSIDRIGIMPDEIVPAPPQPQQASAPDPQLKRALRFLSTGR